MNKSDFWDYLVFLRNLGATLDELTEVEREKECFVRTDDLDGLNECMKREQALTLTLRSYDKKRDEMLLLLGLKDVPLRKLLDYAPAEYREETKKTVEQLSRQYALYRGAFEVARDTLECNLHQIEKILRADDPDAAAQTDYQEPSPQLPTRLRTDFRA
ncbi:hypothetical protein OBV_39780 [Oscillibacter valericigenes Sjm18-20]|nr:hypothetical protein OBV_39780 [Oscillibacter valericigenes Sjm18-20]